jgi:16S rRNA (guanine527-N7)-methyltransferase
MAQLGGRVDSVLNVGPDRPAGRHTVVIIEKVSPTPDRFPRRAGMPAKRPLGKRTP